MKREGTSEPVSGDETYLTAKQAAAYLHLNEKTLYALVAEGTIPSVRVATVGSRRGRVLVMRAGLEAYVASLQTPAVAPPAACRGARVDVDALRARIVREAS